MIKICILDYGIGNIFSLKNVLKKIEVDFTYSRSKKDIINASHLILPGVGSFNIAIKKLSESISLDFLSNEVLQKNKPILGICVGMQIMATYGYENKFANGLNWIQGSVKIINSKNLPLPQVGWNSLLSLKNASILNGIEKKDFYFLNSYYFDIMNNENVIAYSSYGIKFPSIIKKNNIIGVQFHPEKSQKAGFQFMKNFTKLK